MRDELRWEMLFGQNRHMNTAINRFRIIENEQIDKKWRCVSFKTNLLLQISFI